jgi:hypothetical protein
MELGLAEQPNCLPQPREACATQDTLKVKLHRAGPFLPALKGIHELNFIGVAEGMSL